ncbi:DUF72 domain-containing protein [Candidatus Nitrosocosmicus arcticus]|uniref:Sugar isomerase related protein n=1 Tax=Candidatus Nitrosocosmicus arcticus TaxID=2035267 RepID=A0A557SZD4_9ARCH|nr:DUF72 domain-containing protein [Candidatus Nitrosocosmicus arcticus]TVP41961.1 Sugar isomerase related protein [Candidatus Nitrosocosmicus arcticus]
MCSQLYLGCSGWNYGDTSEKGGWLNVFYPDNKTRKLSYYSQFFNTVEMDATFYKRFYENMNEGLFIGITKATPNDFRISVKVPEIITHEKRLDINRNVVIDLNEFLNKISPLESQRKLGAIIIQLPPSFTIDESNRLEKFLDALRNRSDLKNNDNIAIEFRHNSWNTEGVLELLHHFNIASVLTDSPTQENLGFLSNENNLTSTNLAVIRFHGRNTTRDHYWYDYLYSEKELIPWIDKINKIKENTDTIFVYFNNHYGGKAIVNSLQFKELIKNQPLPENEKRVLERAKKYLSNTL